jgi:DNA-binding NarL/FixJ family response regulator
MQAEFYSVGLLEDNIALRNNIEYYLNSTKNYYVCFSESSVEAAIEKTIDCSTDFILLDIHLNNTNALDYISMFKTRFPESKIIMMTGDKSDAFILKAFESGAKGYVYKPFALHDVVATMESLEENGSYMSPDIATKLIGLLNKSEKEESLKVRFKLTDRESDIIDLLIEGYGYKAIAEKLFVSYHTVNHHVKNLYSKLNVKSRSELTATYAVSKH